MTANRPATLWPIRLATFGLLALMASAAAAQQAPFDDPGEQASPPVEASSPSPYHRPVRLVDVEPWTAFEYVDKPFEWLVGKLEATLFYRVAATESQYAQVHHVVYYVRDRGTDGPFRIAESSRNRKPDDLPDEIGEEEATAWIERGKATRSPQPDRVYRLGILSRVNEAGEIREQPVEYVKYIVSDEPKYVRVENDGQVVFQPVTRLRSSLNNDPGTWLTPEQVEQRARAGELALDFDANGEQTPYLFTEHVGGIPLVVIWLFGGAVFFTIYFAFVNFWGFGHAITIVRGTYNDPDEPGEVTHFQALASALSATVGLGNIAGVTIAMTAGGPGAFFWMMLCGFFGMTSKFVECTLGQMYREVKPDGTILGGPMQYLVHAFSQFGLKPVGTVVSIVFAVMCVMASFGGGNMFQANQAASQVLGMVQSEDLRLLNEAKTELAAAAAAEDFERLPELQSRRTQIQDRVDSWAFRFNVIFGFVMATLVGSVIIGGIKRIGATAAKIVPAMCLLYIAACLWIIGSHITDVPMMVMSIFTEAFNPAAVRGGILGVIVIGVQRAAFSNEAGVGSAAIAHSAAKTGEPVREGFVALLEPFVDTIVVCSMTALVILITGAWDNRDWILRQGLEGVQLTSAAFKNEISWFPYVLTVAVVLFAFSTIISWSYYGERCWERMFGARSIMAYKVLFVTAVFLGPIFPLSNVIAFSDIMILAMAFPNILGAILLAPTVKRAAREYWRKFKAGEFNKPT